ncbi:hypothetical protein C8F01DRAFT_1032193 [Mycena amicta]|nr:hypothetical protein C8F01DRAFT_1032193 [Mycena amicta]
MIWRVDSIPRRASLFCFFFFLLAVQKLHLTTSRLPPVTLVLITESPEILSESPPFSSGKPRLLALGKLALQYGYLVCSSSTRE